MTLKLVLVSVAFIFFASCSKYKEGEFIDEGDVVPPSPPFWEYFTVKGFDDDKDGVRDDVEIWINENIKDSNIRRALKTKVGVYQKLMFVRNIEQAYRIVTTDLRGSNSCLMFVQGYLSDIDRQNIPQATDLVFNNFWRKKEIDEASKFVPGGAYSLIDMRLLHQYRACPFKIYGLKKLWDFYYKENGYKNGNKEEEYEFLRMMKEIR